MENLLKTLQFRSGLIPAVVVDAQTGELLTLCYMDEEALRETLRTGQVHVFRRSQGRVMPKGGTSGHVQLVREIRLDCEGSSLALHVEQKVAACHKGYRTCYFRRYDPQSDSFEITCEMGFDPDEVYGGANG